MTPQRLEIADIIRQFGSDYLDKYAASLDQQRVMKNFAMCRTEGLGGHVKKCDFCGHKEVYYNSYRDHY